MSTNKRRVLNCRTKEAKYIKLTAKEIADRIIDIAAEEELETIRNAKAIRERKIQDEIRAMAVERLEAKGEL